MRKLFISQHLVAASLLSLTASLLAQSTLTLHVDQAKTPVSPTLYGLMTEEINYSYDGGLYPELVRNRAFRDAPYPSHWRPVEEGNATAEFTIDRLTGPSEALPQSLKLTISQADQDNAAGVLNDGYWGMTTAPGMKYHGSLYAKGDTGPAIIDLVDDKTGKSIAHAETKPVGKDWAQYTFELTSNAASKSTANHLTVRFRKSGTVWLSLVSVMPPTYKSRPNGLRPDLMEKMAAMKPQFLRFPGGNFLEGDTLKDWYQFKKTIGPLVDRPTHPSPWRYRSSDGLGLLEFLEWCEDLHMQPVLAVYAGYALHGEYVKPGPELDLYIKDALDEIEYVSGDVSTTWGAQRAKDGHPEPFPLKYVEVGNEDWFDKSGSYDQRFAQFYKAIKNRYPAIQVIATDQVKSLTPDLLDEHYYMSAKESFSAAHKYDDRPRTGPKIFVGEWATREGAPTPNFGSALGDAAFMTGMERNSDYVLMASYAPLFVNVNPGGMQWETDLIGYDQGSSFGSPAYWAQVLFGQHLGDVIVPGELKTENKKLFYSATKKQNTLILKLVNASSKPAEIKLAIPNTKGVGTGKIFRLHADSMMATNTLKEPDTIHPQELPWKSSDRELSHTLPPYTIDVIELSLQ